KEWSPHEDELIRRGVEQLGCRWRVIAAQLPGRSDDAVRNRWSRLQDTAKSRTGGRDGGERSSWTRAEDDVIVQGVSELGHKWFEIARRLPGRTDHAIRNRW
ncbi:hypothetical protein EMIHUDRAFT_58434, partial [Emiliania huxleyi CCMP1516]|uniref:Homeodomain-like protein n=2 Tax=Emiliania huxleyi TaxID=2903 RepID=A0A0D3I6Y9_EMIH1